MSRLRTGADGRANARIRLGGAAFVVALMLAGVGCENETGEPDVDPFADRALALLDRLEDGDFEAIAADFDPTMRAGLPPDVLANNWRTYQELLGAYESHGTPERVDRGSLVVERVPLRLANGAKGELRVTYHQDATIAGLFFLKEDAPPP